MGTVIGIDLGTTYSSICAIDQDGKTRMIANQESEYLTPSAVYFTSEKNKVIVGKRAKELSRTDPKNLVLFVKREMGQDKDNVRLDKIEKEYAPYDFWGTRISPEEISAYILSQLKNDAERELNTSISDAVITVPAYFATRERESTRQAAVIAGLNVLEIIPEPTAAALAYCASIAGKKPETVLVFDLGGGTFDATILRTSDLDGVRSAHMIATDGDRRLGGKDWDDAIMNYVLGEFERMYGIAIICERGTEKDITIGNLRLEAEKAKIALSTRDSVRISLSYQGGTINTDLTRTRFEEETSHLVDKCRTYCANLLHDSGITWNQIDTILLAGSMSIIPSIQNGIRSWSGKDVSFGILNPKTSVSTGAAIQAHLSHFGKDGGMAITTPAMNAGWDLVSDGQKTVTVKEVESLSSRTVSRVLATPRNIIPASLGVIAKTENGTPTTAQLINKYTEYPVEVSETFDCASDGLKNIIIKIVEGESEDPEKCDNLGLAELPLSGHNRKGDPIEVTFRLDESGILQVKAKDIAGGNEIQTIIRRQGSLSEKEIVQAQEKHKRLFLG